MMPFDKQSLPANAKILLIRLRSIGDVVLNTAVFPLIKENFPEGRLDYLVTPPHHELVQNNPHLDEIILLNTPGGKSGEKFSLWKYFQTLRRLRKKRYDLVIDMHEGPRSALITALSGGKYKVGLKRSRRSGFYNVNVDPVITEPVTAVAFQTKMLEQLGFSVRYQAPTIYLTKDESNQMSERLANAGISPGEVFGVIHPGVASLHNEWQAEKFAEVADALQTRDNIRIVFACGPNQTDQVEAIRKQMNTASISLARQTTLRGFAALAQKARFLLCHNSGPMHIGAAVGTPVFALFGPDSPAIWTPQVEPHHVFYKGIECSPCTRKTRKLECFDGNAECKRLITSGEVIQTIEENLGWA